MSQEELDLEFYPENALLTKILDQHKAAEGKNYIGWAQLLKKLGAKERKLFGLTAKTTKPTWPKIKPFLRSNMVIVDEIGEGYLAFGITKEELQAELHAIIVSEKTALVQKILSQHKGKEKKSYTPLKAAELKVFGLTTTTPNKKIKETLNPFLNSELTLLEKKPARGKEILYLAYNLPLEEFVKESCLAHGSKELSPGKIADDVPVDKKEFPALFSRMLTTGHFQVTKIDDKFTITGVKYVASAVTTAKVSPTPVPESDQNDRELFRAAFHKLDHGRIYVRICNMRRELGWREERFNALLRKLRADGTIQLHAGDVSTLTEEDVNLSFTDENNFFYATLTWKKP